MIKAFLAGLKGKSTNEIVRLVLDLPRYTPQQIMGLARKQATAYLEAMEELTLITSEVDELKLALSMPVEDADDVTALNDAITEVFDGVFERAELEDLNPLYEYRWYLALMTIEQYIMTVNTIQNIYTRFAQARSTWIKTQMAAIEVEMDEDIDAEQAYNALTEELGPMLVDEVGEA